MIYLYTSFLALLVIFFIFKWLNGSYNENPPSESLKKSFKVKKEYPKLNFEEKKVPRDENDSSFVKSFYLNQEKEWMEFFDEFGFVIIRDIISKEEVEATLNEIWNIIEFKDGKRQPELEMRKKTFGLQEKPVVLPDRCDPRTWEVKENGWPHMSNLGLLGADSSFDKQAILNRLNPNIYKAFSKIYKTDKLWCSFDRYGFIRPTKNVLMGDQRVDKSDWKTNDKWLHMDMNPFKINSNTANYDPKKFNFISENNDNYTTDIKLQGILTLIDAKEENGGFLCIPGFHKVVNQWTEPRKDDSARADVYIIPWDDEIQKYTQKIPTRANSLIIWTSLLPHCNFPNNGDQPRICQYLKLFPARTNAPKEFLEFRKNSILNKLPKDLELNDFQKGILGLNL